MRKGASCLGGCVAALGMAATAPAQILQPQPAAIPGFPAQPAPATAQNRAFRQPTAFSAGQIVRPLPVTSQVRSVADEPRPEWDPLGVPVGTFLLYPSIAIEALGKTNVRATEADRKSDVAAVATAGIAAESQWGRHYIGAETYYRRTEYASLRDEGRPEFGAMLRARYDISAVQNITAIGQFDRLSQPREDINAPDNARIPAQIDRARANVSYQYDNSLVLIDADMTVDRRKYRSTIAFNGDIVDQSTRDFTRYQGALKIGYAISGSTSLIVAGSVNNRVYDRLSGVINRGSKGYTIEGGMLFRPSSLLSAELRAGFLRQKFKSSRLNNAKGLSLNANIVWNALPRTSFRLEAARKVNESSSAIVQSQILTSGTFGIDREILPNLIASAEANYERTKYIGIDRHATLVSAGVKGRYLMSRLTEVIFSIEHVRRTSTVPADRFSGQQARIGIRFTL